MLKVIIMFLAILALMLIILSLMIVITVLIINIDDFINYIAEKCRKRKRIRK